VFYIHTTFIASHSGEECNRKGLGYKGEGWESCPKRGVLEWWSDGGMEGWGAVMLMCTSVAAYNLGAVKEPSLHNPTLHYSTTPILRHSACL
jgi:hypothetical protein